MDDGGGYSSIGVQALPRVRLYRSAALTAGASGTLVSLGWDATSALVEKLGYTHSTSSNAEQVTVDVPGTHCLYAAVRFDAALLLSGIRLEIQVDTGGGFAAVARAALGATGTAIVVSDETTIPAYAEVDLMAGAIIRVQFAGVGAANAPLVEGETYTYFSASLKR